VARRLSLSIVLLKPGTFKTASRGSHAAPARRGFGVPSSIAPLQKLTTFDVT